MLIKLGGGNRTVRYRTATQLSNTSYTKTHTGRNCDDSLAAGLHERASLDWNCGA